MNHSLEGSSSEPTLRTSVVCGQNVPLSVVHGAGRKTTTALGWVGASEMKPQTAFGLLPSLSASRSGTAQQGRAESSLGLETYLGLPIMLCPMTSTEHGAEQGSARLLNTFMKWEWLGYQSAAQRSNMPPTLPYVVPPTGDMSI